MRSLTKSQSFCQSSNFQPRLAWSRLYKSQVGKNMILKSRETYYIFSMYKYYQFTLFLVLIQKFNQIQTFTPDLPELGLIRAEYKA